MTVSGPDVYFRRRRRHLSFCLGLLSCAYLGTVHRRRSDESSVCV